MYHICICVWWGLWASRMWVSEWLNDLREEVRGWVCEFVRVLCVCVEVWNEYVSSALICSLEISIHSLNLTLYTNLVYIYINIYQLTWGRLILILMWGSLNNRYHCRVWQRLGISKRNKSNLERGQCTA